MLKRILHRFVFLLLLAARPVFALNVQFGPEPTQFDPLMLEDGTSLRLAANVIATPFEYDGNGELKKNLVESLSLGRDKLTYRIQFKKGLKWSDGESFHADQFLFALKRLVQEPVRAAMTELFPKIDLSSTKVKDPLTIEVKLKKPDAQFQKWLSLPPFAPIRDSMLETYRKRNPVVPTLAAYRVAEYKREEYVELLKNSHYHQADSVSIERVKIFFLKDEMSLYPMLKQGDLDILSKVPVLQKEQISKIAQVIDYPVEAVTYIGLNTKIPPFNQIQNRQAFLSSIAPHRSELALLLKTGESPSYTFVPGVLLSTSLRDQFKNQQFKKMKNQGGSIQFQVQTDGGTRNEMILQFLQAKLKQDYGWKMGIDTREWKTHYSKLKSDPPQGYRFGWQNPVSDPYVTYQVLVSDSPNNFTGWKNAEYDRLVEELRQETAIENKMKLIKRLEAILADEVPVVPVLHQVLRFGISKRVQGFRANPFGVVLYRELRLTKNQ